jgi:tellurite resistance protein TerC
MEPLLRRAAFDSLGQNRSRVPTVISLFWIGFVAFLLLALALDLGVFHRKARAQTTGEAALWSLMWVSTALVFNLFVYFAYENHWLGIGFVNGVAVNGGQAALEFFTAWVVEESLSLDNIFVIATVMTYFRVPAEHQHRLLYWGVLGALVMRFVFILSGLALVQRFTWMTYVFGAILIFTAIKMLVHKDEGLHPERNGLVRLLQRFMPLTSRHEGASFFVKNANGWHATPMFIALIVVESSDLLFAIDSLPAVIAVTADPFIAFSSNAFAILGLRSLYFVIAPMIARFHYMKQSLMILLAFIGVKMLLTHHVHIPIGVSLGCIGGILGAGVIASLFGRTQSDAVSDATFVDQLVHSGLRTARRVVVGIVGTTVLTLGIAMVVLPGPAVAVIPIGLAILASEFVWARRWLAKIRDNGATQLSTTKAVVLLCGAALIAGAGWAFTSL